MPTLNGVDVRELWAIGFNTRVFKPSRAGLIDTSGEDVVATTNVWAVTGDEAVEIVKRQVEKEGTPWMGLTAVQSLGMLESRIMNQPRYTAAELPTQPSKIKLTGLDTVGPVGVLNEVAPTAVVRAEQPCDNYGGKMAGDFPCVTCGWLYSAHPIPADRSDFR